MSAAVASAAPESDPGRPGPAAGRLAELAAKRPLRFEENAGQVRDSQVRYFARGKGYRLVLTSQEAVFHLRGAGSAETAAVELRLAGGAARPALSGVGALPTRSNYLLGNDPRAWHTGVASFAGVRYGQVYPGIDLVFSGNERRVEQSFFVAAGAEPRRIRLVYAGATAAEVGASGELLLRTPAGELTADRPVAYQEKDGERRPVECRYELSEGTGAPEVRFALGAYDRGLPLVIDPVFSSSTFLGGGGDDIGHAIGVDAAGNVYIAGSTSSTDFLGTFLPGGVQATNAGSFDGFVAKIDPTGTTLLYSTYLGGSSVDEVNGIAVDAAGNAYLTGYTVSTDFPGVTAGALQAASGGGRDAWVAKLNPAGSALLYATYLGGSGSDFGHGIAIDAAGNVYVAGTTGSGNFPGVTAGSLQPALAGGGADAFVTKINAAGSAIVYSTYLGGSGDDNGVQIAVDPAGEAVVAGSSCSTDFPVTAGSLAPASPGADCGSFTYDAWVAKLSPAGTALVYSTYLGGTGNDIAQGLAVDAAGNAYVTGATNSSGFTGVTAGSFQPANPGGYAAFLTQLNAAGSSAGYSTFLGGGGSFGWGVTVDPAGNAYVTGGTGSGFPVVNAATLQPASAGDPDGFVTKVAPTGAVLYSTYFGGTGSDTGYAIAVDGARSSVYVTGGSGSPHLPGIALGAIQVTGAGGPEDAFLVRIVPGGDLTIDKTAGAALVDPGTRLSYTLTYRNVGDAAATGATLTEVVPGSTTFQAGPSTAGWSCAPSSAAGATCTLALGTVAVGASGTATFVVKLDAKLPANAGSIFNTACAHPGPNCATVTTPTTAAPLLAITKTANFGEAKPGNTLRYTLRYANTGNEDASPVLLTDTVPPLSVFDPVSSTPGWSCLPDNSAGAVCTYTVGTLAAGARGAVVFAVNLSGLYSNTGCITIGTTNPELLRRQATPVCSTATNPLH